MPTSIIIHLNESDQQFIDQLEGRTFQIHVLPNGRIRLYEVKIPDYDQKRCPVQIHGERCGKELGHEGKHCWEGGD